MQSLLFFPEMSECGVCIGAREGCVPEPRAGARLSLPGARSLLRSAFTALQAQLLSVHQPRTGYKQELDKPLRQVPCEFPLFEGLQTRSTLRAVFISCYSFRINLISGKHPCQDPFCCAQLFLTTDCSPSPRPLPHYDLQSRGCQCLHKMQQEPGHLVQGTEQLQGADAELLCAVVFTVVAHKCIGGSSCS